MKLNSSHSVGSCVCPAGKFLNGGSCDTCDSSSFKSDKRDEKCTSCDPNALSVSSNGISCECQSPFVSNPEYLSVFVFPPGSKEESVSCISCELGTFQSNYDQTYCESCDNFEITNQTGSISNSSSICDSNY